MVPSNLTHAVILCISVTASGAFLAKCWACYSKDVTMNTEVYFCRCHHSRSCLAALQKLKRVQGMDQGWEERVKIGRGEDWERESLEETWRPEHCYFFWNYHQMKKGTATTNGWCTQPTLSPDVGSQAKALLLPLGQSAGIVRFFWLTAGFVWWERGCSSVPPSRVLGVRDSEAKGMAHSEAQTIIT